MGKYLNSQDRKDWLQLYFVGQALENLKDNDKKYNTETLKYLRSTFTYLVKSFDSMIADYPQYANNYSDDMKYYRLVMLPKEQAYAEIEKRMEKKKDNLLDALYDTIDIAIESNCVGCQGKEECRLKNILEFYEIEQVDPEDNICKWRL